ncbi:S-layer homology domain-containing protein [Acaryochloris sp. IP29b_bin.148]|uniref:S-layer homology domain-containing protein n=1 Tax=Acaryochloris sp. IP29b_bin.148 TaxID=2969218 RepID=UPI00263138E0|nr:S-layer homology domain-containing protein [Acaryochloris sp. IP29b_bin.148]
MVNPNNPNSEPDEVSPSEPGSDPSSEQRAESGPISDELFDSLSDLLGDSPTDEPASLPDIASWSDDPEQPAEAQSSATEEPADSFEDPTFIQMGPEAEPTNEPSVISDSPADDPISAVEPTIPTVNEDEGTQSIPTTWADEPVAPVPSPPIEPDVPIDLTPDLGEPSDPNLPDIAAASTDPADSVADPWSDPAPAVPMDTGIEDPTLIQSSGLSSDVPPSEVPAASTPPDLPSEDRSIPDPWTANLASQPIEATPDEPASEPELGIPPIAESPFDDLAAEVPPASAGATAQDSEGTPEGVGFAAGIPGGVTGDSADSPVPEGIAPDDTQSESAEREPEITPVPESTPVSEPVAVGSSSTSTMSTSGARASDLGALSDKLPLNRYQAVGLLVTLSTLGTITYLGVAGTQQAPSPSVLSSAISSPPSPPTGANSSTNLPASQNPSAVASAPSAPGTAAPSTSGTSNPSAQAPTDPIAGLPQPPTGAIGGLDSPEVVPSQLDISDVPPEHWAHPFITKLHAQGIIPDYPDGKFQPDKPVTRAELAAQIQRAFVNEPGQLSLTFSDISADYWAADAIEGAVNKKFMSGYPEGDFQPDKLVPRYEVLVALVSGLELDIPTAPENSLQRFQDQGQLPDWSKGKIAASTQEKIVVSHPDPGLLKPEANATRAEVAVMIYQSLVQSGRLDPIESQYVVTPDSE